MGDGTPSKWLGNPSDYGVQTRCLVGDPVYALSASFDVSLLSIMLAPFLSNRYQAYRLTTLAVCKKGTSPLSQSTCSRDDAWWYPQVPRTYPDLSFTSNYIDYYRYRVYCWVHFGGTGGVYLRSLIGISATFGTLPKGLRSIEFSYSGAIIPDNCRRLGTCCSDAQIDFAIDGPGGERIEHIYFDRIYETFMVSLLCNLIQLHLRNSNTNCSLFRSRRTRDDPVSSMPREIHHHRRQRKLRFPVGLPLLGSMRLM